MTARSSDNPRGGQWLSRGEDVVAGHADRRMGRGSGAETDWSTHEGASRLARRIKEYWGGRVSCRIEKVEGPAGSWWAVRSTLLFASPARGTQ